MYDAGKILTGIAIFLGLTTFPLWYNAFHLEAARTIPKPQLPKGEEKCVEAGEFMKTEHMVLLNEWRDRVVRDGERYGETMDGQRVLMSLTSTCMDCHSSKADFCDQCHDYLGVNPYCWDCHIDPDQLKQ